VVIEDGLEIAKIKDEVELGLSPELQEYLAANNITTQFQSLMSKDKKVKPFEPPLFGITVLGSSHGFDPKGSTSGYIIWINGRGIMLDPPPFAQNMLKQHAIPSSIIESIIISHCHADHDAGAFQKILDSQKVEVSYSFIQTNYSTAYYNQNYYGIFHQEILCINWNGRRTIEKAIHLQASNYWSAYDHSWSPIQILLFLTHNTLYWFRGLLQ
jgi:hypothetical protein